MILKQIFYKLPNSLKDIISKLALNTTSNDITTLIELLKSKNIINPIANKYKIPFITFSKNLEIKVGGRNKKFERQR